MLDTFQDALAVEEHASSNAGNTRLNAMPQLINEVATLLGDKRLREDAGPLLDEVCSVIQVVAVKVLEIR